MSVDNLIGIPYSRGEGPLPLDRIRDLDGEIEQANCQRTVQLWYARVHGIILPPENALSAESFDDTNAMVVRDLSQEIFPEDFVSYLSFGDLVHAERKNIPQTTTMWTFERAKNLHVAIFAGYSSDSQLTEHFPTIGNWFPPETPLFFHGTNGGSRFTPLDEFIQEYHLVQARRVPDLKEAYQTIYQS